ncbi:hypothetical protein SNOG_08061 [Parastagonospora nodorum SN15]|uniref:Uncharacterized protein n=1 Tax=Phaeosphaeria nodorum (strain SN15 / ATCC MYA-4574 / FGSC 10173) TaxID=321614 RepID=Q0UJK3_PHANO|nr:hypothetical protein SNOG_08061 [Parastagonospora nodorum SN15]EAT84337.1 hypothetical protein SNOG_08061 [Parastagonospora nodorum SN15]
MGSSFPQIDATANAFTGQLGYTTRVLHELERFLPTIRTEKTNSKTSPRVNKAPSVRN